VLYLAEGYSDEEALQAVYGSTVGQLEEPFRTYIKEF